MRTQSFTTLAVVIVLIHPQPLQAQSTATSSNPFDYSNNPYNPVNLARTNPYSWQNSQFNPANQPKNNPMGSPTGPYYTRNRVQVAPNGSQIDTHSPTNQAANAPNLNQSNPYYWPSLKQARPRFRQYNREYNTSDPTKRTQDDPSATSEELPLPTTPPTASGAFVTQHDYRPLYNQHGQQVGYITGNIVYGTDSKPLASIQGTQVIAYRSNAVRWFLNGYLCDDVGRPFAFTSGATGGPVTPITTTSVTKITPLPITTPVTPMPSSESPPQLSQSWSDLTR